MSESDADPLEARSEEAEEVRAFLVMLRGALDALEAAAARRTKRAARTRLSLSACKGELKRLLTRSEAILPPSARIPEPAPERGAAPQPWPALTSLASEIGAMSVPVALSRARDALVSTLEQLGLGRGVDGAPLASDPSGEVVARAAIGACRAFHEVAWSAAEGERQDLMDAARRDLSSLAEVLPEEAFLAAAEEVARDRLRARTPLVSASVVWDRLIAGG